MTAYPEPIPLTRPSTDERELAAVAEVLASGWLAGQGPACARLEEAFCEITDAMQAVAVANCTAGLHLALRAFGIGPGDEVIVPDYTFPATVNAVIYTGAHPKLVDVDERTGNIDPVSAEDAIRDTTKAIIGVDCLGMPAEWDALRDMADRHGLALIEDAACSAGASFRGRPTGSLADVAVFSLHARKGITSGEGGVVVTDDAEVAERVRRASAFGISSAYERQEAAFSPPSFVELGYNYKLSDILAAVALAQTSKLPEFVHRRRTLADEYCRLLGEVPLVRAPSEPSHVQAVWQTYAVTLDASVDRDAVVTALRARGIGCNIGTYAVHQQPAYAALNQHLPRSRSLAAQHLAIPMFDGLKPSDQTRVVRELELVLDDCLNQR